MFAEGWGMGAKNDDALQKGEADKNQLRMDCLTAL